MALLVTTVLALVPAEMLTAPGFNWWDKAQHALAFSVLGLLGLAALPAKPRQVLMGLVVYGVAIELAQWAVGWRFGEWQDVLADTVGLSLAWLLRYLWQRWRPWHRAAPSLNSTHL